MNKLQIHYLEKRRTEEKELYNSSLLILGSKLEKKVAENRSKQSQIGWLHLHKNFVTIQTVHKCDELLYYPKFPDIRSTETKTVCVPVMSIVEYIASEGQKLEKFLICDS